jgi:hypothetical protein
MIENNYSQNGKTKQLLMLVKRSVAAACKSIQVLIAMGLS